jgi:hypothetical protein
MSKDAPGMRGGRSRNETGKLRQKRGDPCWDHRLDTLLSREGADSLSDLLKKG